MDQNQKLEDIKVKIIDFDSYGFLNNISFQVEAMDQNQKLEDIKQQEQLKHIFEKFKEVYQHLEECGNTLEGLEAHQIQVSRIVEKQSKPTVVSFRAYSMDQIIIILKQRLMALPYTVFQPQALELCARKVAAASGDMRKAFGICRGAIEMLETELRESTCTSTLTSMVRVDHMAIALSRAYRSPIVDTIQSLPQHQQIILCSVVKLFRKGKKDATIGELNKFYIDICKSTLIPPVGMMELSCMCRVLSDQGILKLGQSRDDKSRRVTLQVDEADISFALQGIRFFRNCLQ